MSQSNLDQFHRLVQQLFSQYTLAQQAVDHVYANQETASNNETLDSIRQLLTHVKQTEAEIAPLRDSLQSQNIAVPAATQTVVDDTIKIVTTLIPRIGALEKSAVDARERLAPVIHEGVRAASMKSAYAKQKT